MNGALRPPPESPVNLASIDLNLLVPLLALLEDRSVTRAAARVGLSQPAMSHALRRLRSVFDDDLLVRRGAQSTLTPKAERLIGPLREILHRTSGLLTDEAFDPRTYSREITIALSSSAAVVLGERISRLRAVEAPRSRFAFVTEATLPDAFLTERGADLVLLSETIATEHPRERLYEDDWVVIAGSPELTDDTAVQVLREWPHVGFEAPRGSRSYDVLRDHGVVPPVHTTVNDPLLIPHFVAGGRRVAVHRRRVATLMARSMPLWIADFPFPIGGLGIDMVWNPWAGDPPFRAWLRDLLLRAAHEEPTGEASPTGRASPTGGPPSDRTFAD